ncbi:nitroreductase [Mycobacterium sp.]|uniref:nitroreductase n=1 Tax=Mycobacterium sp. TaxID=1785 RepID=UPI003C7552C4
MPTYKNPRVRDSVRSFNKHVTNPAMIALAGRRHWYAAVIRHIGRNSGKRYSTPVVALQVTDGIVVPLPYGSGVDWLRNVLAAGSATITTNGRTYSVARPEVIDAATAEPQLSPSWRWILHASNVDSYVKFSLA